MNRTLKWFGGHWWRGARRLFRAYIHLFLPLVLYPLLFRGLFHRRLSLSDAEVVLVCVSYFALVAPILVSWFTPPSTDPEDNLRAYVRLTDAELTRIGDRLGVDWSHHLTTRVDALLASGHRDEACALYRRETGVTWDQADVVLAVWQAERLKLRSAAIHDRIDSIPFESYSSATCSVPG